MSESCPCTAFPLTPSFISKAENYLCNLLSVIVIIHICGNHFNTTDETTDIFDVDKIYTYLSPDVEYLHGWHLVYVIVALLFALIIVIVLPLLLALEPFLNSKINFVKIKPLLDQFQGSFKDKYR